MEGLKSFIPLWGSGERLGKSLATYILKWCLGSFLINEIKEEDFGFDSDKSTFSLRNLMVDVKAINDALPNLNFNAKLGTIDRIDIFIPWKSFFSEPSDITLFGMKLEVDICNCKDKKDSRPEIELAKSLEESSLFMANGFLNEEIYDVEEQPTKLEDKEEKISMLSGWIENIISMISFSVKELELCLNLEGQDENQKIKIKLDHVNCFQDNSLVEKDSNSSISRVLKFDDIALCIDEQDVIFKSSKNNSINLVLLSDKKYDDSISLFNRKYNSINIEINFQPFKMDLSPKQLEFFFRYYNNLVKVINLSSKEDIKSTDKSKMNEFHFKILMNIKSINIKLFYQQILFNNEFKEQHHSYLQLYFEDVNMDLLSQPKPSMLSIESGYDHLFNSEVKVNLDFKDFKINEYLSSNEYPPIKLKDNQYIYVRDELLPVLYFNEELLDSFNSLNNIKILDKNGLINNNNLEDMQFSGLNSMFYSNLDSNNNSFSFDPNNYIDQVRFKLNVILHFSLQNECIISSDPVWLRIDPRMIDRFENYYKVIMDSFSKNNNLNNININNSNNDNSNNIFDENNIMNDLDLRNDILPKNKKECKLLFNTDFVRLLIFTPCTVLDDDVLLNHEMGRIHIDNWIMDINKVTINYPKLNEINNNLDEISFKIEYQELDISLYLKQQNKIHCFLSIQSSDKYNDFNSPNLEIKFKSNHFEINERLLSPTLNNHSNGYNNNLPVPFPKIFTGFVEGQVKLIENSYLEEVMSFKQKLLNFTKIIVNCHFPIINIKFDKINYDKNQFLVNDIGAYEPIFLKDLNNNEAELDDTSSFYTANDNNYSYTINNQSYFSTDSKIINNSNNLNSLLCLVVYMPNLNIELNFEEDRKYTLNFIECKFFSTTKYQLLNQTYCNIESEEIYLFSDTNDRISLISPNVLNQSKMMLDITAYSNIKIINGNNVKESNVNLSLNNLLVDFNNDMTWINDLVSFGNNNEEALSPVSNTLLNIKLSVSINDLSFIFNFDKKDKLVILLDQLELSSNIFNLNPIIPALIGVKSLKLLVNENEFNWNNKPGYRTEMNYMNNNNNNKNLDAFAMWKELKFVKVADLQYQEVNINLENNNIQKVNINLNNHELLFDVDKTNLQCFLNAVNELLACFNGSNNEDISPNELNENENADDNEEEDSTLFGNSSPINIGTLDQSIHFNILDTIDEDAFTNLPPLPPRRLNNERQIKEEKIIDVESIDENYYAKDNSYRESSWDDLNYDLNYSFEKVKILDFEPLEYIEDYFDKMDFKHDDFENQEKCNFKFVVDEFNIKVKLKSDNNYKDKLVININKVYIEYYTYFSGNVKSKLTFKIMDLFIEDQFLNSKFNDMLIFDKQDKDYCFCFDVQLLNSDDKVIDMEYKVELDLLPIHLFIDQNSCMFLIELFDLKLPNNSNNNYNNNNNSIKHYFQYILINQIKIILDYQPNNINLNNIKNGNYLEVLNLFSFHNAELILLKAELNGVDGIDQLFSTLISMWIPDIQQHQLPNLISGVNAIQPIYNISQGLYDFINMPLMQFKKDGKIIKGVKSGAFNLLKVTTLEALKLSSNVAISAHTVLESAGSLMGVKKNSKAVNQPSGLNEGIELGFQSISRNFNSNNNTNALIQSAPIILLNPIIALAEFFKLSLIGLRNSVEKK